MKKSIVVAAALCWVMSMPAYAQLGGLSRRIGQAKDAVDKANKIADLKMSDKEERQLGEAVSGKLRQEFGVYQNEDVTKYVSLVGNVLAQASERPALDWQFIVLDTDGVNAFAAPGGLVHVTRGALGLIRNEAELAGVLGHEITHVTKKHTVNSIQKNKMVSLTADEVGEGSLAASVISKLAEAAYKGIINNAFDRDDEVEADKVGVTLANKVGYAPGALSDVLTRIAERNKNRAEPNGMFASHPLIKDRVSNIAKVIKDGKLGATATVAVRYTKMITFEARPIEAIEVIEGARGLTGGESAKNDKDSKDTDKKDESKKEESKKDEPKKKGGLLGKFTTSPSEQKQSSQTVASAGARGGVPDRDAKGGSNSNKLTITITPADVAEFKKGIA
jgi:predicted Zn-dependent protease